MPLTGLDHDPVLLGWVRDLHAPRPADGRVRDVAVPANLVAGVHDDDSLQRHVCQDTSHLPEWSSRGDPRLSRWQGWWRRPRVRATVDMRGM